MNNSVNIYNSKKASKTKIWLLFLCFGWSYGSMGSMGTQIFYYLTIGGCGIWAFFRFFTLNKAIKKYNKEIALVSGVNADDMLRLDLI